MKTLRQLQKETEKSLNLLKEGNQTELHRLFEFIAASSINGYDAAVISGDLTAMAVDAEQRGETLDDVIGSDRQEFCRQLAENARPKSTAERVLYWLHYFFGWVLLDAVLQWITDSFLSGSPGLGLHLIPLTGKEFISMCSFALLLSVIRGYPRFAYARGTVKSAFWAGCILLYYLLRRLPVSGPIFSVPLCYVYREALVLAAFAVWLVCELWYQYCVRPPQKQ